MPARSIGRGSIRRKVPGSRVSGDGNQKPDTRNQKRALVLQSSHLNPPDPSPGFLRAVSRWEIVALSVNDVIGSGVYLILPVAAATLLGPASVWAILGAG